MACTSRRRTGWKYGDPNPPWEYHGYLGFAQAFLTKPTLLSICSEEEKGRGSVLKRLKQYQTELAFRRVQPAAGHAETVSIVDAGDCFEYVITLSRKLGVLLDQYRF